MKRLARSPMDSYAWSEYSIPWQASGCTSINLNHPGYSMSIYIKEFMRKMRFYSTCSLPLIHSTAIQLQRIRSPQKPPPRPPLSSIHYFAKIHTASWKDNSNIAIRDRIDRIGHTSTNNRFHLKTDSTWTSPFRGVDYWIFDLSVSRQAYLFALVAAILKSDLASALDLNESPSSSRQTTNPKFFVALHLNSKGCQSPPLSTTTSPI